MQRFVIAVCLLAGTAAGQQDADSKFRALDKNGDGKLTADELKSPQLFKRLDVDRDGAVTLQEARALAPRPTPREFAHGKDPAQRLDLYALKGKSPRIFKSFVLLDPAGPWGPDGGRIYSTALCALALATPCRMSPDFTRGKPVGAYAKALAKHENKQIAARAKLWALRAGRK